MPIPLGFWAAAGAGSASAATYELISTAYGTGSSGTITFSSIPSTYKHLQIRAIWTSTSTAASGYSAMMRLNGDTAANYARHYLSGNGSAVSSGNATSNNEGPIIGDTSGTTNAFTASIIDILDYANTNKNKTIRTLTGRHGASNKISLESGVWLSTAATTSLNIHTNTNFNFTTSSRFSLYGIKG